MTRLDNKILLPTPGKVISANEQSVLIEAVTKVADESRPLLDSMIAVAHGGWFLPPKYAKQIGASPHNANALLACQLEWEPWRLPVTIGLESLGLGNLFEDARTKANAAGQSLAWSPWVSTTTPAERPAAATIVDGSAHGSNYWWRLEDLKLEGTVAQDPVELGERITFRARAPGRKRPYVAIVVDQSETPTPTTIRGPVMMKPVGAHGFAPVEGTAKVLPKVELDRLHAKTLMDFVVCNDQLEEPVLAALERKEARHPKPPSELRELERQLRNDAPASGETKPTK